MSHARPPRLRAAQAAGLSTWPSAVDVDTCADYLVAPVFDYVVSTGPKGKTTAEAINRCHPNVVHVHDWVLRSRHAPMCPGGT